jgi:membrane dipeptidase
MTDSSTAREPMREAAIADVEVRTAHDRLIVIDALQISNWDRASLEELREGGLTAVHVTVAVWETSRDTLNNVARWYRTIRENADLLAPVLRSEDIERAKRDARTGIILGFQNSSPFEDDLALVEVFHRLGVRIAQLTYNIQSLAGASCYEPNDGGLTRFGGNLIAEMNRVGMMVDLSHVGERTSLDAIEASARPVAITHANPRACFDHPRNKSRDVLRALAARGGVLGCSPYPHVLGQGQTDVSDWVDTVVYATELMGPEHVGIGTDSSFGWPDDHLAWIRNGRWTFDGDAGASPTGDLRWPTWPDFFKSPADFPNLTLALEERGFAPHEVAGIMGGNWLRLFHEVCDVEPHG